MAYRKVVRPGRRFGKLVYIGPADGKTKDEHVIGIWQCDCGTEFRRANGRIRNGHTKSCGCLRHGAHFVTHGGSKTAEYTAWNAMRQRCSNINDKAYSNYGGRGIRVCERWINSFENFLKDVGVRPTISHSLDRYPDNDGNYEPGNVRWATIKQQSYNKRNTVKINAFLVELTVPEAARMSGIRETIVYRLARAGDAARIEDGMIKNGWRPSWGDLCPPRNLEDYRWK
jgi:hypothetical protein